MARPSVLTTLLPLLLLCAWPASAGEGRRVELPAAPPSTTLSAGVAVGAPALAPGVAAVPALPQLAPALSAAAGPAAPGPAAPAAAAVAPAASGGPAPLPAAAPGLPKAAPAAGASSGADAGRAEASEAGGGGPAAGGEAEAADARVLFDRAAAAPAGALKLDDVVARAASRPLRAGVFIQQEQEGSLLSSDPRDSSGDVFRYYRPAQLRQDLAEQVQARLTGFEAVGTKLRRAFRLRDRKSEYAAWDAWPRRAKLEYLDALEKSVVAEKGPAAAWSGKVSLLLEKKPGAPDFLSKNPHMEPPPAAYEGAVGAKFLQPELVSDKDSPATSVDQALGRTKLLIAETGHAGTQYHVFVKASPQTLRAQLPRLQAALQLLNDALFAKAAQESFQNVTHPSLLPWHRGRSQRVARLLQEASADPHVPAADDADSEKHAFVGLRYWGTEDGKLVLSFELRGASLPFKQRGPQAARDMGTPELPQRDYTEARRWLSLLSLYAEQLAQGRAPALPARDVALDPAAADRMVSARAAELGMPEGSYYGVADFAKRLTGREDAAPGLLFPFAASAPGSPALRALTDELLKESARLKAGAAPDRTMQYMLWSAYRDWAAAFEARQRGMLDAFWRAVAS